MSKTFEVGYTYTVWVEVEAEDESEAIEKASEVEFDVPDHFELAEWADPIVNEYD